MKITWFGTASLLVESENNQLLIDPFVCLRGSENHPSILDFIETPDILLTHGHFDHIAVVPYIQEAHEANVYCTSLPAKTLEKNGAEADYISIIKPGCELSFGDISVEVLPGKHVKFDKALIRKTIFNTRIFKYIYNVPFLIHSLLAYPEGGETVSYLIKANGKSILLLGSLGLDPNTTYPENVDMLVLPYQGTSNLVEEALKIIDIIKPRTVFLDHFDDAYPPVTSKVDTKGLKKALTEKYPELPVVKPTEGKPVSLL